MASLWQRFKAIFGAKVSKALDRAENPTETLDYSYEQQLTLLQNVKRGIADVVTAKKRLQMQQTTLEQSVVKLETQARQALGGGRRSGDRACAGEDRGDAGTRRRDGRADRFRHARGLHVRQDAARPRAGADGVAVAGRVGPRQAEAGGRCGRRREGARGRRSA